jgi:hypothetical protein
MKTSLLKTIRVRKLGNLVILLLITLSLFIGCTLGETEAFAPVPDEFLDMDDVAEVSRAISNAPLIHRYSGKYVCTNSTANYANAFIYGPIPSGYSAYFHYDFIGASGDINYTYIRHRASGKYLCCTSASNGGNLFFYGPIPAGYEDMFKFKIMYAGVSNYYYFQHKYSGKYMCTGYTHNGGNVHIWGPIPAGHEDRYRFRYY